MGLTRAARRTGRRHAARITVESNNGIAIDVTTSGRGRERHPPVQQPVRSWSRGRDAGHAAWTDGPGPRTKPGSDPHSPG